MSAGRLIPEGPLPPYAHVPGRTPHPVSDPRGHSFGAAPERPAAPDPDDWLSCRVYLRGLELFNGGYYWEAHEAWESLWHACGRAGPAADFLKGLIKLAAAGVKVREGRPRGVVAHARAAAQLFRRIPQERYFGLRVDELTRCADGIADHPPASADPAAPVEVVFPFTLRPESP